MIAFPLFSSVTSLHDLLHSTAFVVARNAETQRITLVDGIPFVPQPESRVADS